MHRGFGAGLARGVDQVVCVSYLRAGMIREKMIPVHVSTYNRPAHGACFRDVCAGGLWYGDVLATLRVRRKNEQATAHH